MSNYRVFCLEYAFVNAFLVTFAYMFVFFGTCSPPRAILGANEHSNCSNCRVCTPVSLTFGSLFGQSSFGALGALWARFEALGPQKREV